MPPRTLDIRKFAYCPDERGKRMVAIECRVEPVSFFSRRKLANKRSHPLKLIITRERYNPAEPLWVLSPRRWLVVDIVAAAAKLVGR
jgi:hypothetical protein